MVESEVQKDWYVVHTYSGYENRVKLNLEQRRESMGMTDFIFQVIVPENEKIKTGPNGELKKVVENDFPGYVLVQMTMTDQSWYVVRNTPGVTGFLGSHGQGSKPNPVTKDEIDRIMHRMGLIERKVDDLKVEVGETVSIIGGAMNGMEGKITSIDREKQEVKVLVDMFGRETETEVPFNDIDKIY
ncbi:transcription termination/antitermination protein NusG [Oenococcus sicerae]|uniref:Transcription termination/antitermination protein NusG n=1 Tax=Oenococcus sicerae TaxID=2203724 RepID=A0AAJ1RF55_9LACO|nr:transcription termination/antitermination protein NusG [Oenococcus sicerae]MDN6900746.1 transcription termination/antitermination protein NusG [Oenococcus sicerae]QAS69255.1 transcription termination/antitermination protein NusG [Oenococcus sicerae]VDK14663.1 Transcription termination/antitermination protein NusG {ECO:0000255/HAMAP-Rule:MF_00948} [Oenococcus sicerae]